MGKTHNTFIDLYAGVGGFRLALEDLKFKCIYTSDFDLNCKKTYQNNFGVDNFFGDVGLSENQDKIPQDFDILCGGIPCQPFSISGKQLGFKDIRGTEFYNIVNIVNSRRPNVLFLENVKNLVSHDKGKTMETMLAVLNSLDYQVFYKVLNTATHANIPQNRERIFIICFDREVYGDNIHFNFPTEIPLTVSLQDILEKEVDKKYFYTKEKNSFYPLLEEAMKSKDTAYQWRRTYVRENKNNLCPTLTANMGTGGHNVPLVLTDSGIRKLTPRECFRLQGFPDSFKIDGLADSHLYKQAGNSVTVPLIKRIIESMNETISGYAR